MKRKQFIKTSSTLIAGGLVAPYISCSTQEDSAKEVTVRTNWAGNYSYKAPYLHTPESVSEVQELVKTLGKQKALGSRHCFNDIADSPGSQISTRNLNKVINIDEDRMTITVESGARYGEFALELDRKGFALHNLASLPHITAVGACTTATHGSGVNNGNLATQVVSMELITPQGDLVNIDRNHPDFYAIVVGLGCFGIITKITLEIQPRYEVRQDVFLDLPLETLVNTFDEIMSAGYSVSLFTDWMDKKVSEVWVKRRMDQEISELGNDFFGSKPASQNIHPIVTLDAENCTDQLGVPGPWYDRLPHFKMGFTPSAGKELQSEFFVSRKDAVDAIKAVEEMRQDIIPHLMITEIRTIAADEFWMSPCHLQESVAIHFTWQQKPKEVMAMIPRIESALAPYNVRPHWGKLFTVDPATLQSRYPRFGEFLALAKQYDPEGKFRNAFLNENIYY